MFIEVSEFLQRVISSEETVMFTMIDPYGHLSSSRYLEFMINHRVSAAEDQFKLYTSDVALDGVGFFLKRSEIDFKRPLTSGQRIKISSWMSDCHKYGFRIDIIILIDNIRVHARGALEFITVDLKSGKPKHCTEGFRTRTDLNTIQKLPLWADFSQNIKGL